MKVAIVYDRVNKWGGAERVLLALNELFPNAPLFTSIYSKNNAKWAEVFPKIIPSFLQKMPFAKTRHEHLAPFMPLAFESHDLKDYDLVISVTSEAAKGVLTGKHQKHICYCLTPTRYLWSGFEEYFKDPVFKGAAKSTINYLRRWDQVAAQRPDIIIAISREVQTRIKRYYGRESEIVYPPVDMKKFIVRSSSFIVRRLPKDYFLVVSRLVPYKKVDLVVETFNELGLPLVVVGTGSGLNRLKKMARGNVRLVGEVGEVALREFYQNAKALIMPQLEDFGLVALEAQAAGVPVISYKKGGAMETVVDGKTGIFFKEQSKISLKKAISIFSSLKFLREDCLRNAEKFSKERFKKNFLQIVKEVL